MTRSRPALRLAAAVLLSLPAVAFAGEHCRHQTQPRTLALDTAGVRTVRFEVGPHDLALEARDGAARVDGVACAKDPADFERLKLTQSREGDKLVVRAQREDRGLRWNSGEARLILRATVPAGVMVQLAVGSGDATVTGARALSINVGSGDVHARGTTGAVTAQVGSGDIDVDGAGSLNVLSIGSGDVEARDVRGDVEVGSIGSGDFSLERAGGDVAIGSIGSGDAELVAVAGSVELRSIGSGDFDVRDVGGDLVVRQKGSGSIDHGGVRGRVELPKR